MLRDHVKDCYGYLVPVGGLEERGFAPFRQGCRHLVQPERVVGGSSVATPNCGVHGNCFGEYQLSPGSAVFSWHWLLGVVRVAQATAIETVAPGARVIGSVTVSANVKPCRGGWA